MIEEQLAEVGREVRSAVAHRLPSVPIEDGLADVVRRRRDRHQRRRVVTLVGAVLVVLAVTIAALAAVRAPGQHVAAGGASSGPDDSEAISNAIAILFEPGHSVDDKLAQVAESSDLRDVITKGMYDQRASTLVAKVTSVDLHGSTATAHIDFFIQGGLAMGGAKLDMVHVGERWVAARESYCTLIATGGPECPTSDGSPAEILARTVTGAEPLLLPSAIPRDWTATTSAEAAGFTVQYQSPSRDQSIFLAIMVPNPAPPSDNGSQSSPMFRGDPMSIYQVDDATNPTSHRWIIWTEPGRWSVEARGGVPYFLTGDGVTDADFWTYANSLQPVAVSTTPPTLPVCAPNQVSMSVTFNPGSELGAIRLTNDGPAPCSLAGQPTMSVFDADRGSVAPNQTMLRRAPDWPPPLQPIALSAAGALPQAVVELDWCGFSMTGSKIEIRFDQWSDALGLISPPDLSPPPCVDGSTSLFAVDYVRGFNTEGIVGPP